MIAGNAGILVTRVLYVKRTEGRTFVIVDAAMNDLIRPTLYEAYHGLRPVIAPGPDAPRLVADVVGPVCESGDYLALDREMRGRDGRRPDRRHERGRLRGGPVLHLQHPAAGAGGAGAGRRAPPWSGRGSRSRPSWPSIAYRTGSRDPRGRGGRPTGG